MNFQAYLEYKQKSGIYTFTSEEAFEKYNGAETAFKKTLLRYQSKNKIIRVKNGFYIIIPIEYQNIGILPPYWFIDDLMKYLECPYYIGLLSACVMYGAAHQQTQIFQVIVPKQLKPINIKGMKIQFIYKKSFSEEFVTDIKTETGIAKISNIEQTILDLLHYSRRSGGWNSIITVISELSNSKLNIKQLIKIYNNISSLQRFGIILDILRKNKESDNLYKWFAKQKSMPIPFDISKKINDSDLNKKWKVYINTSLEADDL